MESFNRFNHRVPRPTALLMIVAGLLLPYIGLGHIGSILGDECYQALCVRSYENAPLAMLSFYTGHVWTTIFGEGILQLRVLMVLCYQISVALPCIYLYRVSRRPLLSAFMFMMLSVGSRMTVLQLYGWDAGAYPFFSAAFLAFIHYVARHNTPRRHPRSCDRPRGYGESHATEHAAHRPRHGHRRATSAVPCHPC